MTFKRPPGFTKPTKDQLSQYHRESAQFTARIRELFGPEFYADTPVPWIKSLNGFSITDRRTMNPGLHVRIVYGARTEEEAIKKAKMELKESDPQELWPYMEDEINQEPDLGEKIIGGKL